MPDKSSHRPIRFHQLRHPVVWLAAGFGSGCAPKAPGTAGTLVAVPMVYAMQQLELWQYLAITVLVTVAGIWLCGKAAELLDTHDHPGIVWDEIAGLFITMIAVPGGWTWLLAGFLLFRLFDILKPWPIGWLDRSVSGGLGIMLDDVLAGLMALAVLQGYAYYMV